MLKKFIVGLALTFATFLPQAASAVIIEAVWDIELQWERPTGTHDWSSVTGPATRQVKTVFADYVSKTLDLSIQHSTYFGTTAENIFDHAVAEDIVDNPFGPAEITRNVSLVTSLVGDDTWQRSLYISFHQIASSPTVDDSYSWLTWETISIHPVQSLPAFSVPTPDDLWNLLNAFQASPELFHQGQFFGGGGIVRRSDGQYLSGTSWFGNVRLASLRRIEVPEPPAVALIGLGLLTAAFLRRRRQAH